MMSFLQSLFDSSQFPVLSAFLLGLMTAISPCPLATNITAIGYISKNLENRKKVFLSGLIYTLGRAVSYSVIGIVLFLGASQFHISSALQSKGEKYISILMIIAGIFMLDILKFRVPGFNINPEKWGQRMNKRHLLISFLLGLLFALAFCPYSGAIFFIFLIPLTISSIDGLYLPVIYAIGTGLPVMVVAWFIAFSFSEIGSFYNKMQVFQKWLNRIVAILFIVIGIYLALIFWFDIQLV